MMDGEEKTTKYANGTNGENSGINRSMTPSWRAGVDLMSKNPETMCSDPTQDVTIRIPCALAERVAAYAKDHAGTLSSVVIEALDFFLRGQKSV